MRLLPQIVLMRYFDAPYFDHFACCREDEAQESEGEDDESSEDESLVESEEESEVELESDEEEGLDWDELEEQAIIEDKARSYSDGEDNAPAKRKRPGGGSAPLKKGRY